MSDTFDALGLAPALLAAVAQQGYTQPTAIQSAAIAPALQGRDVMASAQTGSGKTAAYVLAVLQAFDTSPHAAPRRLRALVLVPTRELAQQVGDTFAALAQRMSQHPKVVVVFGGVSINPQMMGLRGGADVVVATPGRLIDLVNHRALQLGHVKTLVLDEADRLLDDGFADELAAIVALLPARRQHLLFSATLPPAVRALAEQLLHEPVQIGIVAEPADAPQITQRALRVDANKRTPLLRHLIETQGWRCVLVFVATQYASERVADKLRQHGIAAQPFHGDQSQGKRTQVLTDLKLGRLKALIATDVAARGLHIADLPVVLNYDLPRSTVDFVHRIGRTARAGASGLAISFISSDSEAHFRLIEKRNGFRLVREQVAGFEPSEAIDAVPPTGGVKGKRKSKKDKLRDAAAAQHKEVLG